MSIGARIRKVRRDNGLSQDKFGELCGVTKGMVSQWESDTVVPPTDRLITLKEKLDIKFSLDWLLTGEIDYTKSMREPLKNLLLVAEKLPDNAISNLTKEGNTYAELIAEAKKDDPPKTASQ